MYIGNIGYIMVQIGQKKWNVNFSEGLHWHGTYALILRLKHASKSPGSSLKHRFHMFLQILCTVNARCGLMVWILKILRWCRAQGLGLHFEKCSIGMAEDTLVCRFRLLRRCCVRGLGLHFEKYNIGMAEDTLVYGFSLVSSHWSLTLALNKCVPTEGKGCHSIPTSYLA